MTNLTLYNGLNYIFTSDMTSASSSSLSLSSGFVQAPGGIYFNNGDFTVMAWIYPRTFVSNSRIIDFGNSLQTDNIVFSLSDGTSGSPSVTFNQINSIPFSLISTQLLKLNQWQHVSFVFSNSTMNVFIYMNGVIVGVGTASSPPNSLARTNNFIGKSNSAGISNADAIFDEIKIFSVALTQSQIRLEMNNNLFGNSIVSVSTSSFYLAFFSFL